ncbi:MAG: hypothetical protein ACK5V3_04660 [Bdellovibrionales bacterium]
MRLNRILFLFTFVIFQLSWAEITDIKIECLNPKGEVTLNEHMRIERDSVKIYENGGFAVLGQSLLVQRKRVGVLGAIFEPCSASLVSPTKTVLLTCATGSKIEFLNIVLPDDRTKCR